MKILAYPVESIQELLIGRCLHFLYSLQQAILRAHQVIFLLEDKLVSFFHLLESLDRRGVDLAQVLQPLFHPVCLLLQLFYRRLPRPRLIDDVIQVNPEFYIQPLLHSR